MNPLHCIPAYKDAEGQGFWEGNVIVRIIANGTSLVPTDPKVAAKVDQVLYLRTCNIYPKLGPTLMYPTLGWGAPLDAAATEKALVEANEIIDILFTRFFQDGGFAAGELSIAGSFHCCCGGEIGHLNFFIKFFRINFFSPSIMFFCLL